MTTRLTQGIKVLSNVLGPRNKINRNFGRNELLLNEKYTVLQRKVSETDPNLTVREPHLNELFQNYTVIRLNVYRPKTTSSETFLVLTHFKGKFTGRLRKVNGLFVQSGPF